VKWIPGRIEVVVSDNESGEAPNLSATVLENIHREIYTQLEANDHELRIVSSFEILIATPGIGDVLQTDRDFMSFKVSDV
jgi:hypothetical protein